MANNKKNGITLIETLIAVIIFGIGILSIITVIIQNISFMDRIKNQTIATSLAKEGLEIAYNLRDTNLLKSVAWNCAKSEDVQLNPDCNERFGSGENFKVNANMDNYYNFASTDNTWENNILYLHTGEVLSGMNGFWYDYSSADGNKTIFARFIHFDYVKLNGDGGTSDPQKILKIESHVPYKKGALEKEIVLESFIGKIN